MSTLQELKDAISQLPPPERALLTAELIAAGPEIYPPELEAALERGLLDVCEGRVRPLSEVSAVMREWLGRS